MKHAKILIVGGGIGGLTATIALRRRGFEVDVIERDPTWSVYGVGIIQQANVIRAMSELGVLEDYLHAGFGFDHVDVFGWDGGHRVRVPSQSLVKDAPANMGISRVALHKILGARAKAAGGTIRLGDSVARFDQSESSVKVTFVSGGEAAYDIVVAADGTHSSTRLMELPEARPPQFTGQSVWRYNFDRPAEVDGIRAYMGPIGVGFVPLSPSLMYMFVTTPEPGNPRFEKVGIASRMRERLTGAPPFIADLARKITSDDSVVYRPLEWLLLTGDWHKGRIVFLGDAAHSTTPHLGQGAGLAVEDSIVLADELAQANDPQDAFVAYRKRRFERCRYIVETSKAVCDGQLGIGPVVDHAKVTREMFEITAQPI